MIELYLALPLVCLSASTAMAASIVARDPGLKIHLLCGALLGATAWWSLCEVLWHLQDDAASAVLFVRLSGFGWMALGPVCLHMFSEITGRPAFLRRRAVPAAYACAGLGMALYLVNPGIVQARWTEAWGWGYDLQPTFFIPYLVAVTPPTFVLVLWRRFNPDGTLIGGERNVSRTMFGGIVVALAVTLVSEVALPMLGIPWLHLGTASITLVAGVCALLLNRYGFSLLSPGAFSREVLDTLGDGIVLPYSDGRVRFVNRAFEELIGARPGGLVGRTVESLLPGMRAAVAGGQDVAELEIPTESGGRLPAAVHAVPLGDSAVSFVVRDLREIRSLSDRVVTGGRLATVGELSAAIASEIETPTQRVADQLERFRRKWIRAAAQLGSEAGERGELLAEGEELIEECIQGITRVGTIARSVGLFEGDDPGAGTHEDLNEIVEASVGEVLSDAPGSIRIERALGELPRIRCSRREIAEVVAHLVANAVDSAGAEGRILVQTGFDGTEAWIAVVDDGPGIPPEVRDRMFDPFFSTKPAGQGTGLGLPICFHTVERHGGALHHETPPSGGARFEVRLPLH